MNQARSPQFPRWIQMPTNRFTLPEALGSATVTAMMEPARGTWSEKMLQTVKTSVFAVKAIKRHCWQDENNVYWSIKQDKKRFRYMHPLIWFLLHQRARQILSINDVSLSSVPTQHLHYNTFNGLSSMLRKEVLPTERVLDFLLKAGLLSLSWLLWVI